MNLSEIKFELEKNLSKNATVENLAHDEMDGKMSINFAGTLEKSESSEHGEEYYLRVGEDYMAGAMGVGFRPEHVDEILYRSSCNELRVILK